MIDTCHATCAHCGQRISLFECLWRELGSGAVRASYALDLEVLQREGRRLWHVGCFVPATVRQPSFEEIVSVLVEERELTGAVA